MENKTYLIRVAARSEEEAMELVGRHIFMTISEEKKDDAESDGSSEV